MHPLTVIGGVFLFKPVSKDTMKMDSIRPNERIVDSILLPNYNIIVTMALNMFEMGDRD